MKRFLKVILILAAVFGVAGLGLTAGGAAMGATMGDVSVLDHGITQVLRVLDHEDSWEVEDSEEIWMSRRTIFRQLQRAR